MILKNVIKINTDIKKFLMKIKIVFDEVRFSKIVSGYECEYYFRQFKEIESEDSETNKKI